MPTISAYTSDDLKRRIDRIMREEGRNQAQVGSTALELYAVLPPAARRAFLELQAADAEDAGMLERVMADVARVLLAWKWDRVSERLAERGQTNPLAAQDLTEEEIGALAVELTRPRTRGQRVG